MGNRLFPFSRNNGNTVFNMKISLHPLDCGFLEKAGISKGAETNLKKWI